MVIRNLKLDQETFYHIHSVTEVSVYWTMSSNSGNSAISSIRKKSRPIQDFPERKVTSSADSAAGNGSSLSNPRGSVTSPTATGISGGGNKMENLEARAMEDLKSFLERKGINPSKANDYKIHIKQKGAGDSSYTVNYSDRNNFMLFSKNDVFLNLNGPKQKDAAASTKQREAAPAPVSGGREKRNCVIEQLKKNDPEEIKKRLQLQREKEVFSAT